MTKEDLKWLSQFETNFNTAINSNYSRNVLESQLRKMVSIYEKETGKKYPLCFHCSSSVLGFLKDMGKIYLDHKGNEPKLNVNELEKVVTQKERSECTKKENKKVKTKK